MVNDHNSQGETRPDRQRTHLDGGRLLVGIHAPPHPLALPGRVVLARPLPQRTLGPVGLSAPVVRLAPDVLVRLVVRPPRVRPGFLRRPQGGRHLHNTPARCHLEGRVAPARLAAPPGLPPVALVVPVGAVLAGQVGAALVAPAVLVVLVAPAVVSRPASPARISRPHRRRPRRDRSRLRGGVAAP